MYEIADAQTSKQANKPAHNVLDSHTQRIARLTTQETCTDATITVDYEGAVAEFAVHTIVVARCPYFRAALMDGYLRERREHSVSVADLCPPRSIEMLLQHLYGRPLARQDIEQSGEDGKSRVGSCCSSTASHYPTPIATAVGLYYAANYFQIGCLQRQVATLLGTVCTPDSAVPLLEVPTPLVWWWSVSALNN